MPMSLDRARRMAARSVWAEAQLRAAFGKVRDGDYIDYYARVKAAEFAEYHSVVAQWEIDRYLTLF